MLPFLVYALPALVVATALAVLYVRHKRLREVFDSVARRRGGTVAKGPWGFFPRLVVPIDGGEVQVSAIHGSRNGRATSTFAWIGNDEYPELIMDVRRAPSRLGMLEGIGQQKATTGDPEFDAAFWMLADDWKAASELLDEDLRRRLLAFDATLRVRFRVATLLAFPEGWRTGAMKRGIEIAIQKLPPDLDDVQRLLELSRLTHERLLARRKVKAA